MVLAFENSLQYFIINSSMIGFAISVSLYSFITPQIDKLLEKQVQRLKGLNAKLKEASQKYGERLLKTGYDQELHDNLTSAKEKVENAQQVKFHYATGFLITGILFGASSIFPLWNLFRPDVTFAEEFAKASPFFLFVGLALLIYVWMRLFFEIKGLMKKLLDEAIAESDRELQQAEKLQKGLKGKIKDIKPLEVSKDSKND